MNNLDQTENREQYGEVLQISADTCLPVVTLRGLTILPGMVIHFDLSRDCSMESVERAMIGDQRLLVVTQKDASQEEPGFEDLYEVGTVTLIKQVSKLPGHVLRVLVEGIARARLYSYIETEGYHTAQVSYEKDEVSDLDDASIEAMTRSVKEALAAYGACFPKVGKAVEDQIDDSMNLGELLDAITINLPLPTVNKQTILSAISVRERFEALTAMLMREVDVIRIKNELAKDIRQWRS